MSNAVILQQEAPDTKLQSNGNLRIAPGNALWDLGILRPSATWYDDLSLACQEGRKV